MKTDQRSYVPCTPLQRPKDVNAPTLLPLYIGQGEEGRKRARVTSPPPDGADLVPALRCVLDLTAPRDVAMRAVIAAGTDLLALGWLLRVPPLGDMTQTEIGRRLGMTKAAVSKHVRELAKRTGYRRADMKPDRHSPKYSDGALRGWKRRAENDRSYQRAHAELGNVIGARTWFDRLPRHNQRHALVAIGALPTVGAIREILFVMVRVGWRGRVDLAKRLRRIERAHLALAAALIETTKELKEIATRQVSLNREERV